jgi:hypothetical protein
VRAGLELVASVSALKTHAALQTRVGIATGLVVVGDLIGSGASQEQAVVGETPNLAAREKAYHDYDRAICRAYLDQDNPPTGAGSSGPRGSVSRRSTPWRLSAQRLRRGHRVHSEWTSRPTGEARRLVGV